MTPDNPFAAQAKQLVAAAPRPDGGPWYVELAPVGTAAVRLGPYDNPSLARDDARRLADYLAAVMQQARQATG